MIKLINIYRKLFFVVDNTNNINIPPLQRGLGGFHVTPSQKSLIKNKIYLLLIKQSNSLSLRFTEFIEKTRVQSINLIRQFYRFCFENISLSINTLRKLILVGDNTNKGTIPPLQRGLGGFTDYVRDITLCSKHIV